MTYSFQDFIFMNGNKNGIDKIFQELRFLVPKQFFVRFKYKPYFLYIHAHIAPHDFFVLSLICIQHLSCLDGVFS